MNPSPLPEKPKLPIQQWPAEKTNGAKVGLCFFMAFVLLGYPLVISLVLGIVGAIATGWIIFAWRTPEELEQLPLLPTLEDILEPVEERTRLETWRKMESQSRLSTNAAKIGWKKLINFLGEDNRPQQ
ncbi:hypothetical protein QPK87_03700 [Kamptonema cortianum]|uniref:Uncharacterized protein n=1 Tax=Geitlerinema calcuttense NRMC-F 0142 TaxID=2922238 RepID=A0ABT7M088_9CYAN|nr:hypothetical protein [Geitlerinema calcuttense]MCD8489336.1 hypothetical protein [Desertifilum sp.]MDK3155686.1 hypothetical protein [Kamptonema cortianum]MDL5057668.1 hypothetical protein [Geitlerinema calcuttense NRMC-F 0142]